MGLMHVLSLGVTLGLRRGEDGEHLNKAQVICDNMSYHQPKGNKKTQFFCDKSPASEAAQSICFVVSRFLGEWINLFHFTFRDRTYTRREGCVVFYKCLLCHKRASHSLNFNPSKKKGLRGCSEKLCLPSKMPLSFPVVNWYVLASPDDRTWLFLPLQA